MDGLATQNHSMMLPKRVVTLDIAFEKHCQGIFVEGIEMICLTKCVHR